MQSIGWLQKTLQGELSKSARFWLLAATIVLAALTAVLNVKFPLLRLSVLAFVYVLSVQALTDLNWGIFAAIAAAAVFSAAEWTWDPLGQRMFAVSNFFSRMISFLIAIGLVEIIRRQGRTLIDGQRRSHELEMSRLRGQLAESAARFAVVSESIPFGVWHCNSEGRVVYMSASFLDMLGTTLADVRSGGWFDRVVKEDADRIRDAWARRESWPQLWEDEYRIRGVDGKVYTILCRGRAVFDETGRRIGWTGVNFDLTERAKAREHLSFLVDAGRLLSSSLDPSAILERVARLVVPRHADWCAIDTVAEDGELQTAVVQHRDPQKLEIVRQLRGYPRDESQGAMRVLRSGASEHVESITEEMLGSAGRDQRYLDLVRQLELRSLVMVPLQARDRILGVMTLAQAESDRRFGQEDVRFAEMLAARTALAFDNARNYAKEQRVADTFQRATLPTSLPRLPGIRLRATYVPGATESEVGGDWYDAFLLPGGELAVSIGDVAGKGLRAAVSMASTRQALRGSALEGLNPGRILARVNQQLTYEGSGMVTALFGVLDPVTLQFTFATAGHPLPLVGHPDGTVEKLHNRGLPLGLFSDQDYDDVTHKLESGSLLVLFTDGLIEFDRNLSEGEQRLHSAVKSEMEVLTPDPSGAIVRRVILGSPNDDVAVLTVSVSPTPLESLNLVTTSQPANARVIRQSLRRFALSIGLDERRTTDFLVACGEAISNVIEHAYGISDGPLSLQAQREDDELVITVKDKGRWRACRQDGSGRGLLLMRALTDKVEVECGESGSTIRLRLALSERLDGHHDRSSKVPATGR